MTTAVITERAALGIGLGAVDSRPLLAGYGRNLADIVGTSLWSVDAAADDGMCDLPGTMSGAAVLRAAHQVGVLAQHKISSIIPFKHAVALEAAAQQAGVRVLASPAKLARQLENKLQLPDIAAAAGVQIPDTVVISRRAVLDGSAELPELASGWVVQPAISFAGAGTTPVATPDALTQALQHPTAAKSDVWKLTRRIHGEPMTVNAVVADDQDVVVAHVTRQLTGISVCSSEPLGSCGNEWSIPIDVSVAQAVRDTAAAVGRELARRGFRGACGLDVVASPGGDVVVIEINPRITASFGMLNQLQRAHGLVPMIDVHEAVFLDPSGPLLARARECYASELAPWMHAAASVVCYNLTDTVIHAEHDRPWIITASGTRHEVSALDIATLAPGSALAIPQPSGREVPPGGELVRIYVAGQVAADAHTHRLTDAAAQLVVDTRAALGVQRSLPSAR